VISPLADVALYRAKALGRNRVEEADDTASHGITRAKATNPPG
jgi:hypothetical protein